MEKFVDSIYHLLSVLISRMMKRSLKHTMKNTAFIDAAMDEILHESGADRVVIFQFHNGVKKLDGFPFYYFTATHERIVDKAGVYPMSHVYQKIPVTTASYAIGEIIKNNYRWRDVNDIPDAVTKSQCKSVGIKGLVVVPIYSKGGSFPCAMLGLHWMTDTPPDFDAWAESSDAAYNRLLDATKYIGDLL